MTTGTSGHINLHCQYSQYKKYRQSTAASIVTKSLRRITRPPAKFQIQVKYNSIGFQKKFLDII
jgi:hypothetical protein